MFRHVNLIFVTVGVVLFACVASFLVQPVCTELIQNINKAPSNLS